MLINTYQPSKDDDVSSLIKLKRWFNIQQAVIIGNDHDANQEKTG